MGLVFTGWMLFLAGIYESLDEPPIIEYRLDEVQIRATTEKEK